MKKLNFATRAVLTDALNDYRNRDKYFTFTEDYDFFADSPAWTLKINWSAIGATDAGKARLFAVTLADAANFAVRVNALDIHLTAESWRDPTEEDKAFYHKWKDIVAAAVYSCRFNDIYDWLVANLED